MLSRSQIEKMGFAEVGDDVSISEYANFYGVGHISIGNHVRIDDFCVISAGNGGIRIGNYVHIATHCSLIGQGKISMADFSGLSSRVNIYSSSDDYSGECLTNPTVPQEYKDVVTADVYIGRHSIVGTGSVILPGSTLEEGVAVGALSLIRNRCAAFGIYFGSPAKRLRERSRNLLDLEKKLLGTDQ